MARLLLLIYFVAGTIPLLAVAGLNYSVDRWGVFGEFEESYAMEPNARYQKINYYFDHCEDYKGIVYGTSRTEVLNMEAHEEFKNAGRIYNLSASKGSIDELLQILKHLPSGCQPEFIIFGLDMDILPIGPFDDLLRQMPPRITGNTRAFYENYLFSKAATAQSLETRTKGNKDLEATGIVGFYRAVYAGLVSGRRQSDAPTELKLSYNLQNGTVKYDWNKISSLSECKYGRFKEEKFEEYRKHLKGVAEYVRGRMDFYVAIAPIAKERKYFVGVEKITSRIKGLPVKILSIPDSARNLWSPEHWHDCSHFKPEMVGFLHLH